jgi:hypothetical protein
LYREEVLHGTRPKQRSLADRHTSASVSTRQHASAYAHEAEAKEPGWAAIPTRATRRLADGLAARSVLMGRQGGCLMDYNY